MMGLTVFLFYPLEEQTPETSPACSSNGGDLTLVVQKFSCFTFVSTPDHGFFRDFIRASCVSVRLSSFSVQKRHLRGTEVSTLYLISKHGVEERCYRKGPNVKEANTWLFTMMEVNLREQSHP